MTEAAPALQEPDTRALLRSAAEDFARRELELSRVRALRGATPGFERALWMRLAELGWIGALIGEEQADPHSVRRGWRRSSKYWVRLCLRVLCLKMAIRVLL